MTVVDGSSLSAAELVALVEADSLTVDAGLELLDADDRLIEDITADFVADGSSVERGIYRTVHGTARLNITRDIAWGRQRLRPTLLLSSEPPPLPATSGPSESTAILTEAGDPLLTEADDPILTEGSSTSIAAATTQTFYRFPLGVFIPSIPERVVADDPPLWSVDCYDKLDILNTPYGRTYSLAASANVVDAVVQIIIDEGETHIDIEASSLTSGSTRVLSLADNLTTLQVCNELLDSIGYRSLWVDRDGFYRSAPYQPPADLPVRWSYDASSPSTTVGEERRSVADFYGAANIVVGVSDDAERATPPSDGDGLFTLTNEFDGLTSVAERGGRLIRRVITGAYATQGALETAVARIAENEKRVTSYVTISVSPNPVHAHFDVVNFRDDALPVNGRHLVTDWTLPLDGGSDMRLSLRAVT